MLEVQWGRHEQVIILCTFSTQQEGWRAVDKSSILLPSGCWLSPIWLPIPKIASVGYEASWEDLLCLEGSSEDRSVRPGPWLAWRTKRWLMCTPERENELDLDGKELCWKADRREQHYQDQCSDCVRRVIKPDQELTCLPERIGETPYRSQTSKVVNKESTSFHSASQTQSGFSLHRPRDWKR